MKFVQVMTFYDQYLKDYYAAHPYLLNEDYESHMESFFADGFGGLHYFARHMGALGYDASTIIANNVHGQFRWARENGVTIGAPQAWTREVLARQIETLAPDVLFCNDPIMFDSAFIRSLSRRPRLVIGWRAAGIPQGIDWSEYDLILSHLGVCREHALKIGAKAVDHFYPGFPAAFTDWVADEEKRYDVVFCGSWGRQHQARNGMILDLARASRGGALFPLGLFMLTDGLPLPPEVAACNHGPRWGRAMYHALASGRTVFNAESDLNAGEAGNMRLFEATGVGSFLLTEDQENIRRYFDPGTEIETFGSKDELIEKVITYKLDAPRREAVAAAGQRRCLTEHSMQRCVERLDSLIRKYMR